MLHYTSSEMMHENTIACDQMKRDESALCYECNSLRLNIGDIV